jgi:cobalt-zinc-cadmium resistance protein CzcA
VPDITSPQIQINVEVPALAPEETELLVTRILEQELAGLPGLQEMRSLTKFGLSQITLQFKDGVDVYRSRQLVNERLQTVKGDLPRQADPKLTPISTGLGEIFYYNLYWKDGEAPEGMTEVERLQQLYDAQEYIAKPFLRAIPGVAEINSIGGLERQYVINPNPQKLIEANVAFEELAEVISLSTENAGGGVINRDGKRLVIRAVSKAQTLEEIAGLPVKFGAAINPFTVGDVAEVAIGSAVRSGAATENGEETVLGSVMMLAGENSRIVAHRISRNVDELQRRLPAGMALRTQYDRSELVDRTIETVKHNLFEGAILVVVVLLVLLGNWRAAIIVATAIPLSFLFAMIGMSRLEVSGNLMSLGAVDFGLIIDGAVVMVENIVRQLAHRQSELGRRLNPAERTRTVLAAAKQVGNPMFFGVLIITVVYLPILALTGIEGKMFRPMAMTVMLALCGALILALTVIPVLCSIGITGSVQEKDGRLMSFLKSVYSPLLGAALRMKPVVILGAMAIFVLSLVVFGNLGSEFVPKLDEGSTTMMLYRDTGQSLGTSLDKQMALEHEVIETFPEVERVFSRIGTAEVATDPMPPNEADFYVLYHPRDQWREIDGRVPTKVELAEMISDHIREKFPDTDTMVAQPIEMRFNEMLEGIRADLSIKVFGTDYDILEDRAAQIKSILEDLDGVSQIEFETEGRSPILVIRLRRDMLQRRNLNGTAVNEAISTALAGRVVGSMQHDNHVHDVVVRLGGELRESLEMIRELPVRVGDSGLIPLGTLAEIETVEAVEPIRRDNGRRRAALMVNLNTSNVEGWVRNAQQMVSDQVDMPEGYYVEFGGQFEHLQEARHRLMIVVPAALALIFVLIFMAFGSMRQAALVYTGIPLAVTGGIFALWARGMPFSITAAIGFIALSGVAVLNGVVLVSYFNQLREEGLTVSDAVRQGAITRLRPVLMTASVAALGFVPMAISTGAGAEVQRPLATVVIGGILTSTFLTLSLLPVIYEWAEKLTVNVRKQDQKAV